MASRTTVIVVGSLQTLLALTALVLHILHYQERVEHLVAMGSLALLLVLTALIALTQARRRGMRYLPVFLAGVLLMSLGLLTDSYLLVAAGSALVVAGIIGISRTC